MRQNSYLPVWKTIALAKIIYACTGLEEMLASSRAEQSGVRLEVNERIIDSCTALTKAIKILIQKSKTLQREIVDQGRVGAVIVDQGRVWTGFVGYTWALWVMHVRCGVLLGSRIWLHGHVLPATSYM